MERSTDNNCTHFEDLLVRKSLGQITQGETLLLTEHLKGCKQCQAYSDTLAEIASSMQISETDLTPNPEIYEHLKSRLQTAKTVELRILRTLGNRLFRIFNIRIPLYQAVLGTAAILITAFALENVSLSNLDLPESSQTKEPAIVPDRLLHHLKITEAQRIGQTVGEDSLLTKHIVELHDTFLAKSILEGI